MKRSKTMNTSHFTPYGTCAHQEKQSRFQKNVVVRHVSNSISSDAVYQHVFCSQKDANSL